MSQMIENTVATPSQTGDASSMDQTEQSIGSLLDDVRAVIAPVWPLKDYVAVNPYAGIADQPFLNARTFMKTFSDCETLMPLSYFAEKFQQGHYGMSDVMAAVDELGVQAILPEANWSRETIAMVLAASLESTDESDDGSLDLATRVRSLAWYADHQLGIRWTQVIGDEISKFCGAHYDEGQSVWSSPWQDLPLYEAWKNTAAIDRNVEALGLKGFRDLAAQLPDSPAEAIESLLSQSSVPTSIWKEYLLGLAFSVPGWCAWTKYQSDWSDEVDNDDLTGLLAICLAYDIALGQVFDINVNWDFVALQGTESPEFTPSKNALLRSVLLRASELAYRNKLVADMDLTPANETSETSERKLAQMVFCIDVRSERVRRQLEKLSNKIETFGFAGFFGMPVEFVPLGQVSGNSHVPALLKPSFQLHEGLHETAASDESDAIDERVQIRSWRKLWKTFQSSAVGCFSFVETLGLLYGWKLFSQTAFSNKVFSSKGLSGNAPASKDGLAAACREKLGPTLRGLNAQGITTSHQADIAQSVLTNLGLTKAFANLVVLCGHASQTENNPLAAGLDCGACCGHSGEPNARMAAMLLNQTYIRSALADRGIHIPEDTHFVAGLHNTTTDELTYFDLDELPESLQAKMTELQSLSKLATAATATERLPIVDSHSTDDIARRANDWSEVRPEWGLAGNAAFIIAPRSMTKDANLDGRSFMHSYDFRNDPEGAVLESIMTAPMVVAHWINMQYYASTVDNPHFGSGNKTVHNVVGRFGVLSGNGGDLQTGLPWQSLHSGDDFQHLPMRLQAVIAAPKATIERILAKHANVNDLVQNQWMHLIAIEDGQAFQYSADGQWEAIGLSIA